MPFNQTKIDNEKTNKNNDFVKESSKSVKKTRSASNKDFKNKYLEYIKDI